MNFILVLLALAGMFKTEAITDNKGFSTTEPPLRHLSTAFCETSLQQDGWQKVLITRAITRNDSRINLERSMLSEARIKAVEQASGIAVRSIESIQTAERIESVNMQKGAPAWFQDYIYLNQQESSGRIVEEKESSFTETMLDGQHALELHYEARVVPEEGMADPGFHGKLTSRQPAYRVNDTIHIEVLSSRNAQLYLFNLLPDGSGKLIWPNRLEKNNALQAGEPLVLPKNSARYAFVAEVSEQLTASETQSQELLFGILFTGSEQLFSPEEAFGRSFSFEEINRMLLRIPRHMRTELMAVYSIAN